MSAFVNQLLLASVVFVCVVIAVAVYKHYINGVANTSASETSQTQPEPSKQPVIGPRKREPIKTELNEKEEHSDVNDISDVINFRNQQN